MKPFKPPLIPKLSKSPKKITSIDEFLRNLLFDLNMLNDKRENNTARNVLMIDVAVQVIIQPKTSKQYNQKLTIGQMEYVNYLIQLLIFLFESNFGGSLDDKNQHHIEN